jgi:hypothetical protein
VTTTHICPECEEPAVKQPPTDLVPFPALGITQPEWSHLDGSSLCPVMGPNGCQPAEPRPCDPVTGASG